MSTSKHSERDTTKMGLGVQGFCETLLKIKCFVFFGWVGGIRTAVKNISVAAGNF